jgi:hypothetical protein
VSPSAIHATLAATLSRSSTPGPSPVAPALHKKRKRSEHSQKRSPRKRVPTVTLEDEYLSNTKGIESVTSHPIGSTGQRRQQSAANWAAVLQALVYPLMALTPVLRGLGPREVLWGGTGHVIQCVSGCEVKGSEVNIISFGGEWHF